MGISSRIASFFSRFRRRKADREIRPKKVVPSLGTPNYLDRHKGETFLVMGLGPSLLENREQIFQFIEQYQPIVMGANNITAFLIPDYHAFTNRARFTKYVHTVDTDKSKVLLSPYFAKWLIRNHFLGEYEELMYDSGPVVSFDIWNGVVMAGFQSVSVVLIGVALVMGAQQVFVAGLDGYRSVLTPDRKTHYYGVENQKDEDREDAEFIRREKITHQYLDEISQYMAMRGLERFKILTPTAYDKHYSPINQFLKS